MSVSVIGVDCGQKGGIAYLSDFFTEAVPMPMAGKEIDTRRFISFLEQREVGVVVMERVHSMPKQGVRSVWTFAYGVGVVVGAVEALGLPLRWVTPQAWKGVVLSGTAKDKAAAISHVRQAYPSIDLIPPRARTPHDGIADAVCIAEYGRRTIHL